MNTRLITLEGNEHGCHSLSKAEAIRFVRQTGKLKRALDLHAVELLLLMAGIEDPPTVTEANADALTAALTPLLPQGKPAETVLTGQAAVDKLREARGE